MKTMAIWRAPILCSANAPSRTMTRAQAIGDVDPRPERVGREKSRGRSSGRGGGGVEEEEKGVGSGATHNMAPKRPDQLTLKRRRQKNWYKEFARAQDRCWQPATGALCLLKELRQHFSHNEQVARSITFDLRVQGKVELH